MGKLTECMVLQYESFEFDCQNLLKYYPANVVYNRCTTFSKEECAL